MTRVRLLALLVAAVVLSGLALPAGAHTPGFPVPAVGAVSKKNMEWVWGSWDGGGNAMDLFERRDADGTIHRYGVLATHANGFDIVDITDPTAPEMISRYVGDPVPDPGNPGGGTNDSLVGFNYHPWVSVNPRRNIVALTIEDLAGAGTAARHGVGTGIQFVDISDVDNPVPLGKINGLEGPHTVRMIGDNFAYTTLPTYIIDYSDPMNPKNVNPGRASICGHEFFEDPNIPNRAYVGFCGSFRWGILDVADPASPRVISETQDNTIQFGHEVFPSPDSSFVGVTDLRAGPFEARCPGGGIHFFDISGKYVPGATLEKPKKMGTWFAPWSAASPDPSSGNANSASCTTHSWQFQPERMIFTAGLMSGGSWVGDGSEATKAGGGLYTEYPGSAAMNAPPGKTTWSNTTGNFFAEGTYVNASQWLPFDLTNPAHEKLVLNNGLARGLDVLTYSGPMPKKMARLRVSADASGGVVSGVLERYAVLTYSGWVNKPLAGKAVTLTAGGQSVTVTTGEDGSYSANLGLGGGSHQVTVTWEGDDVYQVTSVSRTVTA